MGKTDYLEAQFLDHVFGTIPGDAFVQPTMFIGLFTVTPTADDGTGGTEVTGGAYARVALVQDGVTNTMGAAVAGLMTSAEAIVFPTATANWGTIQGAAFFDASTGGNMLYFQDLTAPAPVNNGDTARYNAGSIVVTDD